MKSLRRLLLFNLGLIPILILCFVGVAYVIQREFNSIAEQEVLENAHLMMETAKASRVYTTEQIEPLLTHEEARIADAVKNVNLVINSQLPVALQQAIDGLPSARERQTLQVLSQQIVENVRQQPRSTQEPEFAPQSIPFYAATEAFNYFGSSTPPILIRRQLSTQQILGTVPWNGRQTS